MFKKLKSQPLLMVLCCLVPIGLVGVLWFWDLEGKWLLYLVFLACPLSHIFLIKGVPKEHHGSHESERNRK